jgi:LacI family transcriptional regulator
MLTALPALTSVAVITSLVRRALDQSTFTRDIIAGIRSRLASPANVQIIAHEAGNHDITDVAVFDASALAQTTQGVLGLEANNAAVLNELVRDGVAVVAIDFWSPRSQFDVLTVDHEDAGYIATEHLLSLGHRVIGFVGETPNLKSSDPTWQARLTGYMRAMVAGGAADFPRWILGVQRDATLIPPRLPEFHRRIKATAYVLCNGGLLPNSLKVFEEMGLRCPEHISFACADGAVPHLGRPATSHVVVDFEEVGRMALRVLASRLACRSMPPVRVTVPVNFLPGCTTARVGAKA